MCVASLCALCRFDVEQDDGSATVNREPWTDLGAGHVLEHILCKMPGCAELRHVCHARCRQMVEPVCLQPLVQVTRHSHNPAENEAKRRRRWLHADLARQLAICHASQKPALSLDVWYCIAGQLLQPYALAKARGALPDPSGIAVGAVTTARQMWYGFTEYEGVRYVSWLSNSPRERRSLRLTFEADRAPERLLVAENNLGVKKLSLADFCRSDCVADEEPGTRWRAIRLDPAGTSMDVETDATAYSFFWGCGLLHVHTHMTDEDPTFQPPFPYYSLLYMPLDQDEFITEIWQRKANFARERAVGMVTSKGRIFVAGAYLKAQQKPFVLVERPSRKVSRVYFEDSADGVSALAFASDAPRMDDASFACPQPSPNKVYIATEDFFFSSHRLEDVEEITPCLAEDGSGVTGLLLRFPNGHRGSLGEIRLHRLGTPLTLEATSSWFLAF